MFTFCSTLIKSRWRDSPERWDAIETIVSWNWKAVRGKLFSSLESGASSGNIWRHQTTENDLLEYWNSSFFIEITHCQTGTKDVFFFPILFTQLLAHTKNGIFAKNHFWHFHFPFKFKLFSSPCVPFRRLVVIDQVQQENGEV